MTTQELEKALLLVADFAFEHGEILKAMRLLEAAPLVLEDSIEIKKLLERVNRRLDYISYFQENGRYNINFVDPVNVEYKTVYQILKKELIKRPLVKYLVDVGCFTGWVGRNLSQDGYTVLGIDVNPLILRDAKRYATGTKATFRYLEATQLGKEYPGVFDGAILFDIVEHVFDYFILLKSVEKSVKKDGWIFINLPGYIKEKEISVAPTDDLHKEHIRSFSKKDVDKIFGKKKNVEIMEYKDEIGGSYYFITYQI